MKRCIHAASSWWLLTLGLSASIFVYLLYAFGDDAFQKWSHFMFFSPPGLLIVITIAAGLLTPTIRIVRNRFFDERTSDGIPVDDQHLSLSFADPGGTILSRLAEFLRGKRFSVYLHREKLIAVKGRFSFLPGVVMRLGLFLWIVFSALILHTRITGHAVMHCGEIETIMGTPLKLEKVNVDLPGDFLQVGEKSIFRLESVSALVSLGDEQVLLGSGFPRRVGPFYARISDVGIAQMLTIHTGKERVSKQFDLKVLPPGKTDFIPLHNEGLVLNISLKPEKEVVQGLLKGKVYNLRIPQYRLIVQRGRDQLRKKEMIIVSGGKAEDGPLSLEAGASETFVEVQAVKDSFLMWLYVSALLSLTGIITMLSRFFWYEQKLTAINRDGKTFISYYEEFFRKWGVMKFYEWAEKLDLFTEPSPEESDSADHEKNTAEERP